MSLPLSETGLPPRCEICGIGTVSIGKLPRIGLRPLVYVYKCDACNQITSVEPEQQEETIRRRTAPMLLVEIDRIKSPIPTPARLSS